MGLAGTPKSSSSRQQVYGGRQDCGDRPLPSRYAGKKIVTADGPNAHTPRQATTVWPLPDKPDVFRPRYPFRGGIRALLTNGDCRTGLQKHPPGAIHAPCIARFDPHHRPPAAWTQAAIARNGPPQHRRIATVNFFATETHPPGTLIRHPLIQWTRRHAKNRHRWETFTV